MEDMYSDAPIPEKHQDKEAPGEAETDKKEGDEKGEEFPLPKEVLQGKEFNVGDEVVLRITGMHDNQIFVAYAPEKGKDEKKEGMDSEGGMGEGEGSPMQGDKEMSSMYG